MNKMKPYLVTLFLLFFPLLLTHCSIALSGKVVLVDQKNNPIENLPRDNVTLNIIKVDAKKITQSAFSLHTDKSGAFDTSQSDHKIGKGLYKIEVFKKGFAISSITAKVDASKTFTIRLKKIEEVNSNVFSEDLAEPEFKSSGSVSIQPPQL